MATYPQTKIISEVEVRQLSKYDFDVQNPEQNLDFYFRVRRSGRVEVIMFDSLIPFGGEADPYLYDFEADSLELAVKDAMAWIRPLSS